MADRIRVAQPIRLQRLLSYTSWILRNPFIFSRVLTNFVNLEFSCTVHHISKTLYFLFLFSCSFQTETEFQEWMKEIKQSFQQAQVMMRAGAKIMSSGHRYITQYSKEENGPVTPWITHSHAHIPSCTYTQKQGSRAWISRTATGPVP